MQVNDRPGTRPANGPRMLRGLWLRVTSCSGHTQRPASAETRMHSNPPSRVECDSCLLAKGPDALGDPATEGSGDARTPWRWQATVYGVGRGPARGKRATADAYAAAHSARSRNAMLSYTRPSHAEGIAPGAWARRQSLRSLLLHCTAPLRRHTRLAPSQRPSGLTSQSRQHCHCKRDYSQVGPLRAAGAEGRRPSRCRGARIARRDPQPRVCHCALCRLPRRSSGSAPSEHVPKQQCCPLRRPYALPPLQPLPSPELAAVSPHGVEATYRPIVGPPAQPLGGGAEVAEEGAGLGGALEMADGPQRVWGARLGAHLWRCVLWHAGKVARICVVCGGVGWRGRWGDGREGTDGVIPTHFGSTSGSCHAGVMKIFEPLLA